MFESWEKPAGLQQEGEAQNKTPEQGAEKNKMLSPEETLEKRYNIKAEDLEQIPDFKELSAGQKAMVVDNFQQAAYARITERALERRDEETKEAGWLGKMKREFFHRGTYRKAEEAEAAEFLKGGMAANGEMLKDLVAMTKESGLDASIKENGELEILYGGSTEGLSPEEKEIVDGFNEAAGALVEKGAEWKYGFFEKKKFAKTRKAYDENFEKLINLKHRQLGNDKDAALAMAQIDRNVQMNQLLTTDDDIEKTMSTVESEATYKRVLKSAAMERGGYMALGAAARTITGGFLGIAMAPAVAAGIGAWTSRERSLRKIREEATYAEGGKEQKMFRKVGSFNLSRKEIENLKRAEKSHETEEEFQKRKADLLAELEKQEKAGKKPAEKEKLLNVVDVKHLTKRLEGLMEKLKETKDEDKKKEIRTELNNRLFYTQQKLDSGLVNYGSEKERLKNQYNLLMMQSSAEIEAALAEPEVNNAVQARLDEFLSYKEGKVSKKVRMDTLKGALISGGCAVLGYTIRDFFSGFHSDAAEYVRHLFGGQSSAGPAVHEAAAHAAAMPHGSGGTAMHEAATAAIPRGEAVPVPEASVHEVAATIDKGGNIWEAAHRLGVSHKEFLELWNNPDSAYNGHHLSDMTLVHPGDKIVAVYNAAGKGPHLELIPGGHGKPGTDYDFYRLVTEKKFGPKATLGKVEPMGMTNDHPIEEMFGAHGAGVGQAAHETAAQAAGHAAGQTGPVAPHHAGDWTKEVFGKPSSGHQNTMGYPDHYPPTIPTHPDHPAGNPIWELHHEASLHPDPVSIDAKNLVGEAKFSYDAGGNPVKLQENFTIFGSTGHEYFSKNFEDILTRYASANHLDASKVIGKMHLADRDLLTHIKVYDQIKSNPYYSKESDFLLKNIKRGIQEITKTYGPGILDKTKLAEFLKK